MSDRKKRWQLLQRLLCGYARERFAVTAARAEIQGPCLIVANHVTNWDPLLLAVSFPDTPIRFVASEHLFRHGLLSEVIQWAVAPIPRRKAASGTDTVKSVLRAVQAGDTVCIFAEGDTTWDGRTHPVFPATGKLARMAGVPLVTYRLEGGYLSMPRWSNTLRRGMMHGGIVGCYAPEELKGMQGGAVNALINRDLFEDAFARQEKEHVRFRGERRAEGIERGFFVCPRCGALGAVRGIGNRVRCACGLDLLYTEEGFFDPPEPVATVAAWEQYQRAALREMLKRADGVLFSDGGLRLKRVGDGHREKALGAGILVQHPDALEIAGRFFPLRDIDSMAMVKTDTLLFSVGDAYYEIRAAAPCCLRKYLLIWESRAENAKE